MALNDPVSCLLCLEAFERPEMLKVQLRAIAGNGAHQHLICQKCGGAIAAEYLYVQNAGKPETSISKSGDSEHQEQALQGATLQPLPDPVPELEPDAATAGVGETNIVDARGEPAESPKRDTKKGRKESMKDTIRP